MPQYEPMSSVSMKTASEAFEVSHKSCTFHLYIKLHKLKVMSRVCTRLYQPLVFSSCPTIFKTTTIYDYFTQILAYFTTFPHRNIRLAIRFTLSNTCKSTLGYPMTHQLTFVKTRKYSKDGRNAFISASELELQPTVCEERRRWDEAQGG